MKELILFDKKMKGAKRQNDIFTFVIATIVIIGIIFWVKSCK
jgi:heme/copper-type cytochrome/quinol oxidase subunit 4